MRRAYAVSLGAIAMALVVMRGVLEGALVEGTIMNALLAFIIFAAAGMAAGAIMDYLIQTEVEDRYRRRVAWLWQQCEQRPADNGSVKQQSQ